MNLEIYFEEEFNNKQEIELRLLNHNKKLTKNSLLNVMPIVTELGNVEICKDRTKIEHADKDAIHTLKNQEVKQKERKKGNEDEKKKC